MSPYAFTRWFLSYIIFCLMSRWKDYFLLKKFFFSNYFMLHIKISIDSLYDTILLILLYKHNFHTCKCYSSKIHQNTNYVRMAIQGNAVTMYKFAILLTLKVYEVFF